MDTIVALSSPRGNSPRAILRLSGGHALQLVLEVFSPEPASTPHETTRSYSCLKGKILLEENTHAPCTLYVMRAPHSYTREDVVEVHTVGSLPLIEMLLEGLVSRARRSGRTLRLAEPGEFTKRAFLNGRIDLSQAEAVMRVIRSKTNAELRLAVRQLRGENLHTLRKAHNHLAELLCHLELSLDFSDQEIEPLPIEALRGRLEALYKELSGYRQDKETIQRDGIRTVLYGPPNAGKSSLFNALLGRPRAITSPHPGTTRDCLEATLTLGGIPFCLVDTAGLRQARDVEALAVIRGQKAVESSDLTLLVLDGSKIPETLGSFQRPDGENTCPGRNLPDILVINKSDLPQRLCPKDLPYDWRDLPVVHTSALTGEGLEGLRQEMVKRVLNGKVDNTPCPLHPRQRLLLGETLEAIERALSLMEQSNPQELVALEIREALDTLGEVCGTITTDDILNRIFSQFCIGK